MSGTKSERIRAAGGTGMCFARPERGQRHQRRMAAGVSEARCEGQGGGVESMGIDVPRGARAAGCKSGTPGRTPKSSGTQLIERETTRRERAHVV
jgi:hypothetical protein